MKEGEKNEVNSFLSYAEALIDYVTLQKEEIDMRRVEFTFGSVCRELNELPHKNYQRMRRWVKSI
jgi:hypothetical protein